MKNKINQGNQKQQKAKNCGNKNCGNKDCKNSENHSYNHGGNND